MFFACPPEKITLLIDLLKQNVARHHIEPDHILGHNEIAPLRKSDPGPLFPWQRLAQAGLIRWPDATQVAQCKQTFEQQLPDIAWFQRKRVQHGYVLACSNQLDEAARQMLVAFQMKYRPNLFDGLPEAETTALLDVLTSTSSGNP